MASKRVGTCAVATERHGEPTGHNMISVTPYCEQCNPTHALASPGGPRDLCKRKHVGRRYCNMCRDYTDDWQQCQWYVAHNEGRWTSFGFCENKARELHHMDARHGGGKVWRWVCHTHTPDAFTKRKDKQEAKFQAWKDGLDRRVRRSGDRHDMEDLLVDIAGWMAKNPELVAEDEWLQTIANKMSDNESLMEAIKS